MAAGNEPKAPEIPAAIIAALQNSGFPFQTAIRHAITSATPRGFSVYASEYPW